MNNNEDRTVKFDLHTRSQLIASFHIYIQSKMLDFDRQQFLKGYFALAVKETLSEAESETMGHILDRAYQDPELTTLIQVVDQQINEQIYTTHPDYLEEIEAVRVNALKKILGDSVQPKSDQALKPVKFAHKLCLLAKLKKHIVPLSLTLVGFIFAFFYDEALSIAENLRDSRNMVVMGQTPHNTKNKSRVYKRSTPAIQAVPHKCQRTDVRWVHQDFEGARTAYGRRFDNSQDTAAHEFLPPGSKIHLQSEKTDQSVVVEVNDRNNSLLVSYSAAAKLGVVDTGIAPVVVERVEVSKANVEEYLSNAQLAQLANFQQSCGFLVTYNYQR